MSELFDTSKIPDEPEYWDALASSVATTAVAQAGRETGLLHFASSSSSWIAASTLATAAAIVVFILQATSGRETAWGDALQPSDEIGRSILVSEQPPSVGALLIEGPGEGGR